MRLTVLVAAVLFVLAPGAGDVRAGPARPPIRRTGSTPRPLAVESVRTVRVPLPPKTLEPRRVTVPGARRGWVVRIPRDHEGTRTTTSAQLGNTPSAAVQDGRVFVGGGFDERALHALDAKTGRHLWTRDLEDNGPSTVAVTPGPVVVNTESCTTYAITPSDGRVAWSRNVGPNVAGAPSVVDDRVYTAHRATTNETLLTAMRLEDGDVVWQQPIPSDLIGAPVHRGGRLYLSGTNGWVAAFSLAGDLLWITQPRAGSAPWAGPDGVYVASEVAWRQHAPVVVALDPSSGRVRWTTDPAPVGGEGRAEPERFTEHNRVTTSRTSWAADPARPCLVKGRCVVASGRELVVLDVEDGAVENLWRLPAGRRFHSAPAVLGDTLLFATLDGLVLELDPVAGEVVRALDIQQTVTSQPVVSDGMAYVVAGDLLVALPWGEKGDGARWPQWGGGSGRGGIR